MNTQAEPVTGKPVFLPLAATCLLLVFGLFFLARDPQANAFAIYLLAVVMLTGLFRADCRAALAEPGLLLWTCSGLLVLYLGLSTAWSDSASSELYRNLGKALLILAFMSGVVFCLVRHSRFVIGLPVFVVAVAVTSAMLSLYLHVKLPEYQPLPEPRLYAFGRLANPAHAALSYGMAVFMAAFLLLQPQIWPARFGLVAGLLVLLTAIVLTGSRAVWLAMALSISIAVALRYRQQAWLVVVGGLVGAAALATIALGQEAVLRRGLSFRPEIWSEFLSRTLAENWLLGVGTGTSSDWVTPVLTFQHPHSVFVSTFYFGGVIGLLLLLMLIALSVRRLIEAPESPARQLAIMAGVYALTMGTFDGNNILNSLEPVWWISWLPVALVMVAVRRD